MPILRSALAALVMLGLASAADAQTTLRFAHTQPVSDPGHQAAVAFKERVEERSGGALKVEIFPGGVLGSDPAMLEGIRLGTIDLALTGNPFYTRFEPSLMLVDLPFLFASDDDAGRVLDGDIGRQLLDRLDRHRMKGLAYWEIGFRQLTNSRHAVRAVEDIAGLKIRTTPNPAHVQAFTLLGAIPTPLPWTETYTALETGAVDGQENPLPVIVSGKLYEVQKHLTLTRHAYVSYILSMSASKWNGLKEDEQVILMEAAAFANQKHRELVRKANEEGLALLRDNGVEVIEEFDTAPLQEKVRQVEVDYAAQYGDAVLKQIRAGQ